MKAFSLLCFLSLFPCGTVAQLGSVPFGGVDLQLQSISPEKNPESLLVEVLTQTVKYLDYSFNEIVKDSDVIFSHVGLSVDSFDIHPNRNSVDQETNDVRFTFSGTAFFETNPPPTQDEVLKILAQSFLGKNSQIFTRTLMQSSDPFLQRLSYAVVQVNGFVIPGGVVQEQPAQNSMSEQSIDIIEIAIVAGSVTGTIVLVLFFYCILCARVEDIDEQSTSVPDKPPVPASETNKTDEIEAMSAAPSSPQSIASQDSSVFTYNPSSKISFDGSTLSTNTLDTNAPELASWQQKHVINSSRFAPFGHDISAIEMLNENKKDLSLIEEGDEAPTPVKPKDEYLSKDSLLGRERRDRSSSRSNSRQETDGSDVLEELHNLSQQINRYRRR